MKLERESVSGNCHWQFSFIFTDEWLECYSYYKQIQNNPCYLY